MAEILVKFDEPISTPAIGSFLAQAMGKRRDDTLWEGWLEFVPVEGGESLCCDRETTQPNRADLLYWAQGLTRVYLQGALDRAARLARTARAGTNAVSSRAATTAS
jgi:hypothetical protein